MSNYKRISALLVPAMITLSFSTSSIAQTKVECYEKHKVVYRDYPLKVTHMRNYEILSYSDHDDMIFNGKCKSYKMSKTINKIKFHQP